MQDTRLNDYIRLNCATDSKQQLKQLAKAKGTDMSTIVRTALVQYLKDELQVPELAAAFDV